MIVVVFYYYVGKKQHLLASLRKTERNIFVPSGLVTGVFEELPLVIVHQSSRCLVKEVAAAALHLAVQSRQTLAGLFTILATFLLS